jgi:hypothetical protein
MTRNKSNKKEELREAMRNHLLLPTEEAKTSKRKSEVISIKPAERTKDNKIEAKMIGSEKKEGK